MSNDPPPQTGWLDLYKRIQWLEWTVGQQTERLTIHSNSQTQEIIRLRLEMEKTSEKIQSRIEEMRNEHNALIMKVFFGALSLVAAAVFNGVWGILTGHGVK